MLDRIRGAAKAVTDKVGDVLGAGWDRLKGQIDELAAASPALGQIGYRIGEIDLEFTIPPRLVVHLARFADAGDEAFQAVLANHADNATFCAVVRLLRQTNRVLGRVQIKGRRLREVEVSLGLPPSVRARYAAPEDAPGPASPAGPPPPGPTAGP
jgi:hypothetical protein